MNWHVKSNGIELRKREEVKAVGPGRSVDHCGQTGAIGVTDDLLKPEARSAGARLAEAFLSTSQSRTYRLFPALRRGRLLFQPVVFTGRQR